MQLLDCLRKGWYGNTMAGQKLKRIFLAVVILGILGGAIWVFLQVSKPSLEVTVTGNHNPIESRVYLGEERLYPSGPGGTIYKTRTWPGNHTATLRGPFIQDGQAKVSLSFFGKEQIEINGNPRTAEDIVRSVMSGTSGNIEGIRTFGLTIVFVIHNASEPEHGDETSYPIMITYDTKTNEWLRIDSQKVSNHSDLEIPQAAADYYYSLNNE